MIKWQLTISDGLCNFPTICTTMKQCGSNILMKASHQPPTILEYIEKVIITNDNFFKAYYTHNICFS